MELEEALARISADAPTPGERTELVGLYTDGSCLAFAFAVHWMTGFPVEAISAPTGEGSAFVHFAAVGPDGDIWDAQGPRPREECVAHFLDDAVWTRIDAYKFLGTDPALDEAAIDAAALAALRLLAPYLAEHVRRLPEALMEPVPARGM